jgi:hypothetical protein
VRAAGAAAAVLVAAGVVAILVTWSSAPAPALTFGIYPGGEAGTVGPRDRARPEDPEKRRRALERLRAGTGPFVVRLYAPYVGEGSDAGIDAATLAQVREYAAARFRVEIVLTYRPPASADPALAVADFAAFVRRAVVQLRAERSVTSLQITNEVNVQASFDASDGAHPGARDALLAGVVAAKQQVRRTGATHLRIGFSWGYERGPGADAFWRELGRRGGPAFAGAVDWVGLDIYPGTWGPALRADGLGDGVREAMVSALQTLRQRHMREAGLPASVALHVAENGYPTGPGRSEATQAAVAAAAVRAVDDVRETFHVTDYRWFSLRDANSSTASFESQYGLLRDDYEPKRAYAVYRSLVAELGRAG